MKRKMLAFVALLCAVCALLFLVACGQPAASTSKDEDVQSQEEVDESGKADEENKTESEAEEAKETTPQQTTDSGSADDGRIDVLNNGAKVATYDGAKCIVSDATIDQGENKGDFGVQEFCVLHQPSTWEGVGSIGWTRNSIAYNNVSLPLGSSSYSYAYINEGGVQGEDQGLGRATEEGFFGEVEGVSHATVDGHYIAYVRRDSGQSDSDMGIVDMEAEADATTSNSEITLYTFEQRGEKCAFTCNATWTVAQGTQDWYSDIELLCMVYEPLSFAQKDDLVDAASYASDLTISNAKGNRQLVIARANDDLLSYTRNSVVLLEDDNPDALMRTTIYDFNPSEEPWADAQQFEVGNRKVLASVSEMADASDSGESVRMLEAWATFGKSTLYVKATMGSQEDLSAALDRVIAQRVTKA